MFYYSFFCVWLVQVETFLDFDKSSQGVVFTTDRPYQPGEQVNTESFSPLKIVRNHEVCPLVCCIHQLWAIYVNEMNDSLVDNLFRFSSHMARNLMESYYYPMDLFQRREPILVIQLSCQCHSQNLINVIRRSWKL